MIGKKMSKSLFYQVELHTQRKLGRKTDRQTERKTDWYGTATYLQAKKGGDQLELQPNLYYMLKLTQMYRPRYKS